jgi:hypothetical protein
VNLFPPLAPESRRILDGLSVLIDKLFPVPQRFFPALPRDVAELSRLLTARRGSRKVSYLGQPKHLSAYLRYFLPWNLYRLCRLLPALPLSLNDGDAVIDLGSGPLTLPAALWISRPGFRDRALEFRCLDRAAPALEAGKRLFAALSGGAAPWTIKTIKAAAGPGPCGPPARLITAVNFFNELYEDMPHGDSAGLRRFSDQQARFLSALAAEEGALLVMEPGVPRSGEFIAALRASLLEQGRKPAAPCPHAGLCPCPGGRGSGGKGRWCHFAFETRDAAPALLKISAAAGIPKERAVLSFLYCGSACSAPPGIPAGPASAVLPARILSDAFPVKSGGSGGGKRGGADAACGRYGCCEKGLILLRGSREQMRSCEAGMLVELVFSGAERRDSKSGALVFEGFKVPPGTAKLDR